MSRQRRRDTAPEMALRRELHRRGLRYRVDRPVIAGTRSRADLDFATARVAVFVDGCFWHGCPYHGTFPKNNAGWWREKLAANQLRDRTSDRLLTEAGWQVVRIWEHEPANAAADAVEAAVREALHRRQADNRRP